MLVYIFVPSSSSPTTLANHLNFLPKASKHDQICQNNCGIVEAYLFLRIDLVSNILETVNIPTNAPLPLPSPQT